MKPLAYHYFKDFKIKVSTLTGVGPKKETALVGVGLKDLGSLLFYKPRKYIDRTTLDKGDTLIEDAAELRVKESDRISTTITMLDKFKVSVDERSDGMLIKGNSAEKYISAEIESYGDHRIAMSSAIMGLMVSGKTKVNNVSCIQTSFPDFESLLEKVIKC